MNYRTRGICFSAFSRIANSRAVVWLTPKLRAIFSSIFRAVALNRNEVADFSMWESLSQPCRIIQRGSFRSLVLLFSNLLLPPGIMQDTEDGKGRGEHQESIYWVSLNEARTEMQYRKGPYADQKNKGEEHQKLRQNLLHKYSIPQFALHSKGVF